MELLSLFLYLLLTFTFLQVLFPLIRRSPKLPPGPAKLPVIGNLLKLGAKPHRSLAELAQIHGPIMSLKLGQITTIVISSPPIAKQVLQKQDLVFSSRSVPNALHAHDHHKYSVGWLPVTDSWRSLRKIMYANIFSASKLDANQPLRRRKVEELIAYAGKCSQDGVAMDIGAAAFMTSLNLLSNTLFSVDLADLSGDSGKEFRDLVWGLMEESAKPNLVDYFPALAKFDPQGNRGRMIVYYGQVFKIFGRMINQRLEMRRLGKTHAHNDVIDNLLNMIEQNGEEIDRTHMDHLCLDLFAAGTDTTASTVEWGMAELLHNPKILKKAKAELEQVIGKGKLIDESDIARLPYLQAVVKETMRLHPAAPLLVPRQVEIDVELAGYAIPKGSQVLVNAWAISRDPSVWPNPNSFMPERFVGSVIDVRGQDFELIPFGAGRRICPALPLAIRVVPSTLGSLINSFDWKLEDGIEPNDLDMEDKFGLTLQRAQSLRAFPIHM